MSPRKGHPRDPLFMAECLRLAEKGVGATSPNPLVGAVLVKGQEIVARGYHHAFGKPHAEIECLGGYRGNCEGATLYVNLEPCSHQGKTPPCVEEILRRGVSRVVIGMRDPNPYVSGKGITKLRRHGVQVEVGMMEEECRTLNRKFTTHITARRPYVTVKIASTLDGKIAPAHRPTRWISGPESRTLVHRWRAEHDAILVGAGTVRRDNPFLTVRHVQGRDPAAIILDGRLSIDPKSRVVRSAARRRVIVCARAVSAKRKPRVVSRLQEQGVEVLTVRSPTPVLSLKTILRELYRDNIGSILVEGGAHVFSQFVHQRLYDELQIFIAPGFMGRGLTAIAPDVHLRLARRMPSHRMEVGKVGNDALLSMFVE